MEKPQTIRGLLGLTQKELALVLGIDRTVYVKYESGSRDLPLKAKRLLAEMLQYVQNPELASKVLPHTAMQNDKKHRQLQRLLKENEYQLLVITKELAAVEKAYNGSVNAMHTLDFLTNHDSIAIPEYLLNSISRRAAAVMEKSGQDELIKCQMKRETLEFEKLFIEYKLQKLARDTENKGTE